MINGGWSVNMCSAATSQRLKSRLTGPETFFGPCAFLMTELTRNLVAERISVGQRTGEPWTLLERELMLTRTHI